MNIRGRKTFNFIRQLITQFIILMSVIVFTWYLITLYKFQVSSVDRFNDVAKSIQQIKQWTEYSFLFNHEQYKEMVFQNTQEYNYSLDRTITYLSLYAKMYPASEQEINQLIKSLQDNRKVRMIFVKGLKK